MRLSLVSQTVMHLLVETSTLDVSSDICLHFLPVHIFMPVSLSLSLSLFQRPVSLVMHCLYRLCLTQYLHDYETRLGINVLHNVEVKNIDRVHNDTQGAEEFQLVDANGNMYGCK